jgi:TolB protein
MSYEFNDPDEFYPVPKRRSPWKIGLYLTIVMAIIVGLLWSAISGVAWLVGQAQTETAVATTAPIPTQPATADVANTPIPSAASGAEPTLNRIVFINDKGQVETIAPDGGERRQISDEAAVFQFPAWSPTGDYVAAVGGGGIFRFADEAEADSLELYSSRSQRPFYLYWSPDGRSLTFLANHPQGIGLHLTPTDLADASRLLAVGNPFYWDWTADSSQILMHSGFSGDEARLALVDVDSGRGGPNAAMPGHFQAPGISSDGRYWAYAELDDNGLSWLVAADAETGNVQRQRHAGQTAMGWSPTANQLAFVSGGEGRLDFAGPLRLMDAATGEARLLSRDVVLAFFWSPDGRYMATITLESENEGTIAAANKQLRLSKPAQQSHPALNLNLILIDAASGERRRLLSFQPTFSFITQFLPYFDQYALSHRLWSPQSDALVLPIQDDEVSRIAVIPINGELRFLADGDMPFWSQQ